MMFCFFFFNDTATTEIYTLSLHDALPISRAHGRAETGGAGGARLRPAGGAEEAVRAGDRGRTMTRRVLISGGAGFVGSHVAEAYVAAGDEVTVLEIGRAHV